MKSTFKFACDSRMGLWKRDFSNSTLFNFKYPLVVSLSWKHMIAACLESKFSRPKSWNKSI